MRTLPHGDLKDFNSLERRQKGISFNVKMPFVNASRDLYLAAVSSFISLTLIVERWQRFSRIPQTQLFNAFCWLPAACYYMFFSAKIETLECICLRQQFDGGFFFPYRISNLTAFNVMSHNAMSKSKLDMYQFFSKWKILSRNQKRWSRALFLISVVGGVSENAQFRREVAASAGADEKLRRAKRRENSNGLKHLCFDFLMILFIFKS